MLTPSLLNRFIFKEIVKSFVLSISFLLALVLISRGVQMRELFMNLDLSITDVAQLFFYMMPLFLLIILPISCMLSIFLTFLRMGADKELLALKAGGISLYQMLKSPFYFSLLCMLFAFFISLHGISWGMEQFRDRVLQLAHSKAQLVLQPGIFNQDLLGKTLFAKQVNAKTGELSDIIFEDKTDAGSSVIFLAPSGNIETDKKAGEMYFTLKNGHIYKVEDNRINILHFASYKVHLDLGKLLSSVEIAGLRPKEMSWQQLLLMDYEKNAPSTRFQNKVGVEIQKRLSLPVACLILGLFSVPIACFFQGVRQQIGVFVALLMFLAYYSIFSLGISLGESGALAPKISLWLGNIVFSLITLFSLYTVGKERNIEQLLTMTLFKGKSKS